MSSHSWKQINTQDIKNIASLGPHLTNVVTDISFVDSTSTLTLTRDIGNDLTTVIPGRVPTEFVGFYAYQNSGSTSIGDTSLFPFESTQMNYETMFGLGNTTTAINTTATIPSGLGGKWAFGYNVICSGNIVYHAWSSLSNYKIFLQKHNSNGSGGGERGAFSYGPYDSPPASCQAHGVIELEAGDTIRVANLSGGAVTFTGSIDPRGSYFYAYRVSE